MSTCRGSERCIQGLGGEITRHRREFRIKIDLHEVGCGSHGLDLSGS